MTHMEVTPAIQSLIGLALEEDWGRGDCTAVAIPEGTIARAKLVAKEDMILSGLELVPALFRETGLSVGRLQINVENGDRVTKGQTVLETTDDARTLLGLERTLLNFLQRCSGIATFAAKIRERIGSRSVRIVDTRKTTPGWRHLEKKAVRDGGLWFVEPSICSG